MTISAGHHNAIAEVADDNGLPAGFVSERSNGGKTLTDSEWLVHGVLRFPDAATATTAAAEFAVAATAERGLLQTADWTAADLPGAQTEHAATIARALERQRPLLDSFTATPEAELARLPYDPDGSSRCRSAAIAAARGMAAAPAPAGRARRVLSDRRRGARRCLGLPGDQQSHVAEIWARTQDAAHTGVRDQQRVLVAAKWRPVSPRSVGDRADLAGWRLHSKNGDT
ncbi:hypothetical protein ACFWM1_25415 [Nocardia sp. NPDC058379]|uniref:DUF7373 family lipoprotein n=1 Tax=unclassified Nocardia TaxID=2637762 RepID=UPI00365640F1